MGMWRTIVTPKWDPFITGCVGHNDTWDGTWSWPLHESSSERSSSTSIYSDFIAKVIHSWRTEAEAALSVRLGDSHEGTLCGWLEICPPLMWVVVDAYAEDALSVRLGDSYEGTLCRWLEICPPLMWVVVDAYGSWYGLCVQKLLWPVATLRVELTPTSNMIPIQPSNIHLCFTNDLTSSTTTTTPDFPIASFDSGIKISGINNTSINSTGLLILGERILLYCRNMSNNGFTSTIKWKVKKSKSIGFGHGVRILQIRSSSEGVSSLSTVDLSKFSLFRGRGA
ncbi:hypothetical protein LguiA_011562 [Lonicera macranthoides]